MVQRRFVDMSHPHVAALEATIVGENWSGPIELRSALDGTVTNSGVARYRGLRGDHLVPVEQGDLGGGAIYLQVQTRQSRIFIAEAARTRLRLDGRPVSDRPRRDRGAGIRRPELARRVATRARRSPSRRWSPSTRRATRRSRRPGWRPARRSTTWAASPSCWNPTCSPGTCCGAASTCRSPASARPSWPSGSTSSTCCRRCRPTPSASTVASRPEACTARPTAGTSSGTSCSSSPCSTCGSRC